MLTNSDTHETFPADKAADIVQCLLGIVDRLDLGYPPGPLSGKEVEIIRQAEALLEWLNGEIGA